METRWETCQIKRRIVHTKRHLLGGARYTARFVAEAIGPNGIYYAGEPEEVTFNGDDTGYGIERELIDNPKVWTIFEAFVRRLA